MHEEYASFATTDDLAGGDVEAAATGKGALRTP
jgi:hypothetical protein